MLAILTTTEFKFSSNTITVLMFIQDEIFIVCSDNCCMPLTTRYDCGTTQQHSVVHKL